MASWPSVQMKSVMLMMVVVPSGSCLVHIMSVQHSILKACLAARDEYIALRPSVQCGESVNLAGSITSIMCPGLRLARRPWNGSREVGADHLRLPLLEQLAGFCNMSVKLLRQLRFPAYRSNS